MYMQNEFNLVTAGAVWKKKWQVVFLCTLLAGTIAGVAVYLVPQYYEGRVTIVSANPALADKARLFNDHIQNLYSYFGSGDDLDRIQGMADMDTTYKKLVDELALIGYYRPSEKTLSLKRAAAVRKLRRDIHFERTENGQLKISAWTRQPRLSADIANRMTTIVKEMQENIWQANYDASLQKLQHAAGNMEQEYQQLSDSLPLLSESKKQLTAVHLQTLLEQIKQYRKTADEFALAAQAHPEGLYVLEPAVAASKPGKPEKLNIVLAACAAGFVFSTLVLLFRNAQARA
jgi:capsular polysaccharide biosynthesis protein